MILTIYDPLENLNGFLYVYANNTLVFEKDLRVGNGGNGYDNITVYAKDLNKDEIFDGANNIKVVYKKLNGKQYTKQTVVHFINIFGTIIPTYISSSWKTLAYNENKFLCAVLTDNKDAPIAGKIIHIKGIGQSFTLRTNSKGEISYHLSKLAPGSYIVAFEFKGDKIYKKSTKTCRVNVNKATPKITAKAKSFKKSVKTKKYKVTLKNNLNKVMKNTKVTLKVNKKTYTAKTNSKCVATIKITKLTKKGKFTATVKYAGSKYYNAKSVKVKITVK
ncbi:hypothetical protein [Methanobrevibacter sp.]